MNGGHVGLYFCLGGERNEMPPLVLAGVPTLQAVGGIQGCLFKKAQV